MFCLASFLTACLNFKRAGCGIYHRKRLVTNQVAVDLNCSILICIDCLVSSSMVILSEFIIRILESSDNFCLCLYFASCCLTYLLALPFAIWLEDLPLPIDKFFCSRASTCIHVLHAVERCVTDCTFRVILQKWSCSMKFLSASLRASFLNHHHHRDCCFLPAH